jgi:hypothetical protein
MLADDLAVAEIVMLMNEAVVEGFKVGMSYQRDSDGGKIGKFSGNGVSIDGKNPGAFVSHFVPAICFSGREDKMSHTYQDEKKFPADHIFGGAVGLEPSPSLAEDFGDAFSALGPMFVDHPLDERNVSVANSSFSDSYWPHDEYISEEGRGRQQKMQGIKEYFSRQF